MEGWQLSFIETLQSGNPINFRTSNNSFTGLTTVRTSVNGSSIPAGLTPARNGAATFVGYVSQSSFVDPGNAFGNLGRNVVLGPGFSNLDFSLVKNLKLFERSSLQIRADAFDLLNQTNFGQPATTFSSASTSTFGLISSTRFPTGDSGSSRQLQLALKFIF